MKAEIEAQLGCLIGQPLSYMQRYAGCQRFSFGQAYEAKNRRGKEMIRYDYGVVISCLWEIFIEEVRIVGRTDFGPGDIRRDEDAKWFYKVVDTQQLIVKKIHGRSDGGFTMEFSDAVTLNLTPEFSRKQRYSKSEKKLREMLLRDGELWRFMPKKQGNDYPSHFVVTADGWYGTDE